MLNLTASNPNGRKAEIRQSEEPYNVGYSVFTWHDCGNGVLLWREKHELTWDNAYTIVMNWLNDGVF